MGTPTKKQYKSESNPYVWNRIYSKTFRGKRGYGMKWNFDESIRQHGYNDNIATYAFIHCITELEQRTGKKLLEDIKSSDNTYDIVFSINGVEMDFTDVLKAYEQNYDDLLKKKAIELLKEKTDKIYHYVDQLEHEAIKLLSE